MGLKVILTGATGMVGEGVLHECLNHPGVEKILLLTRKSTGNNHPKIQELIHPDFYDLGKISEQLKGYDACFFCLGVSAIGLTEEEYFKRTYTLTMNVANILVRQNNNMTFCYISGAGTDSTEKGKMMWARVKGKTENDLQKLPFKNVYLFRPGYMQPTHGLKNTLKYYKYISWMYPAMRLVVPNFVSTLAELGQAMINAALKGYSKKILEVKDIKELASQVKSAKS